MVVAMNPFLRENEKFIHVIETLSKSFSTFGFTRIKTSAFEKYDLYSQVTNSLNRQEMVKVIDLNGEVLVLRPDVTIPITQELSHVSDKLTREYRFYYIQEVFRQSFDKSEKTERSQAGIEYFCQSSPEADAEVIALAILTMKDLAFKEIKIEIGHSVFFEEVMNSLILDQQQINQIKSLLQAKNIVELKPFLNTIKGNSEVKKCIEQIPYLYGKPEEILKRAKAVMQTPNVLETISHIEEVCRILALYGLEEHLVLDFGLINHMDYYSGIVFQGYVERLGKPVLMGGRYDQLGKKFGSDLPAIGFACEIEALVKVSSDHGFENRQLVDVVIIYEASELRQAIRMAGDLRKRNMKVVSLPLYKEQCNGVESDYVIHLRDDRNTVRYEGSERRFSTIEELDF